MAGTDVVVRFVGDTTKLRSEVGKLESTGGRIRGWARGVGTALAGAFALAMAPGHAQNDALGNVAAALARHDPQGALAWAEELPKAAKVMR